MLSKTAAGTLPYLTSASFNGWTFHHLLKTQASLLCGVKQAASLFVVLVANSKIALEL